LKVLAPTIVILVTVALVIDYLYGVAVRGLNMWEPDSLTWIMHTIALPIAGPDRLMPLVCE